MKNLIKVSLRQSAIFIPAAACAQSVKEISETSTILLANARKLGFTFSEPLLHALNAAAPKLKHEILEALREVMGTNKNWTPLVKGWDIPTGESRSDHIIAFFANVLKLNWGSKLKCGHYIPKKTFPLERYNGCPFCGTPFQQEELKLNEQGSKLKVLDLWKEDDMTNYLNDLLKSKTALDATQVESLKTLILSFDIPNVAVAMKETLMLLIDTLVEKGDAEKAASYFSTPNDILRYLWYKKTGFLQIVEPKTIINKTKENNTHLFNFFSNCNTASLDKKKALKLKYSRKECKMVASWLNGLSMSPKKVCEIMHPKRNMWVRFIRALRLAEYSKKAGFEQLKTILDIFYNKKYKVWQGILNKNRQQFNAEKSLRILKEKPGVFARSLFSNMLWFGDDITINAFADVVDQVPARLVFSLNMYADNYFKPNGKRSVKTLGGIRKTIDTHPLLEMYDQKQLDGMKAKIEDLTLLAMKKRFAGVPNKSKTIYIDPALFNMPVSIGERSENVQDMPSALMGTRFPLEGNEVRLFMQWGEGMPAQHLDMDLSCYVAYEHKAQFCSYSSLTIPGCQHSGDIRSIPSKVGTAEYINIDVDKLETLGAKYVSFTCNAYSNGNLTANMVVGWMDSKHSMRISRKSGVAYDPSCVQHQVRITQPLAKGLVFGVLDVEAREVIWLEMPYYGQVVQGLNLNGVETLLNKLDSRLNIGTLLNIKAEAQGLKLTEDAEADEVYDIQWATNTAAVTQLLVD